MLNPFTNTECQNKILIFNKYWFGELEINPQTINNACQLICSSNPPENILQYQKYFRRFITEYTRDIDPETKMPRKWSAAVNREEVEMLKRLCWEVFPKKDVASQ